MKISLHCDCGRTTWQETVTADEVDQVLWCDSCGSRIVATVTRLQTTSTSSAD